MTQTATATGFATEFEDAAAIADETTSAATTDFPDARRNGAGKKPVAVPVSRALGGGKPRRSDQRWEVTEADLNMYGLIVGRAPSDAERVAALTPVPNEATALHDAGAGRGGSGSFMRWRGRGGHGDVPTWSPSVMFAYLRDVYHFSTNLSGPQVSAWVRHVSTEARRRLQETQARLAAPRTR